MMKKIYFLLLALSLFSVANAQIINFPDANFKAKLLEASPSNPIAKDVNGVNIKIDSNNNNEIEVNEVLSVFQLAVDNAYISNLTGIEYFINNRFLDCHSNDLTSLDISGLNNVQNLICTGNQLTSLNIAGLTNLTNLSCDYNGLSSLNFTGLPNLTNLNCSHNQFTNIDVTNIPKLWVFNCSYNQLITLDISPLIQIHDFFCDHNQLVSLYIKNGKNESPIIFNYNPNLQYVCVDESQLISIQQQIAFYGYTNCVVNSYCSFVPGGTFYTIQGSSKYDSNNNNSCDGSDISFPNLKFSIISGTASGNLISNSSGNYSIPAQAGTHTITPVLENPSYFNVSPTSVNVTFPTQASPFIQNFCVTANGVHPDLEITILPLGVARPGFDAVYKIIYKNKGTNAQSGTVNFTFDDVVLDFVSAAPITTAQILNTLSWDYTNLLPFETREITFTLNVNSPMETPAVNSGDVLHYTTTITSPATDDTPNDNTLAFNQTVVNSLDPNDKTCLEGTTISPSMIGDYVHYMIRFENTGTFPAQNIVVKDIIDTAKFDINTLVPIKGSHSFVTKITNGNKVEFIFENINLPFDNANNDGFVAFKIKTKPTLVLGDTFENTANIYFDYNFPIVTNTATTTIQTLGTSDFEFSNYFTLYPNPTKEILNIAVKNGVEVKSINIYNTIGQLVIAIPNAQTVSTIDVSLLTAGNYFIKMTTDKGTSNTKFIKD